MRRLVFIIIVCFTAAICWGQKQYVFRMKNTHKHYVRLLFAGDAMQHGPQIKAAWNSQTKQYNYEANFRYLEPYIEEADINIVNVETSFPGSDYCGYPRFRSPDAYFNAMVDAGFNVFALANNHVLDGGGQGMERTLNLISPYPSLGAYLSNEHRIEKYPLVALIGGIKIAIFNATYGTNDLKVKKPKTVNYIDTKQIEADITASLADSTIDLRIMYIHWGEEYRLLHNKEQEKLAYWLANMGIDVIIGSHPHVVQDYHIIPTQDGRRVPVVYSLGNLVSNQTWTNSNGGIIAMVDINRQTKEVQKLHFIPYYVHRGKLGGDGDPSHQNKYQYYCIPTQEYLDGKLPFVLPDQVSEDKLKLFHQNTLERMGIE